MRVRHAIVLLALLAGSAAIARPAPAEDEVGLTPIPGTGVRLAVPEGFQLADDFPGIGRAEDTTSLLVTELAVPVEIARRDFEAGELGGGGLRVDRIFPVEVGKRSGWLAHATQRAAGLTFRKWILLMGDDARSVLLTATTPLDLEEVHQGALVSALRSARWSPATSGQAQQGAALPFRVDEVGALRIVRSNANAVVLTDPSPRAEGVAPLVSVGVSHAHVQIGDVAAFARERLEESATLEEIEILRESPRSLDGMPGHEIHARARETGSEREVVVTQLLATDGARYFLVQAIVDARERDDFAPWVDALVASFRRVSNP